MEERTNSNRTKILIAAGAVLVLAGLAFGAYKLFANKDGTETKDHWIEVTLNDVPITEEEDERMGGLPIEPNRRHETYFSRIKQSGDYETSRAITCQTAGLQEGCDPRFGTNPEVIKSGKINQEQIDFLKEPMMRPRMQLFTDFKYFQDSPWYRSCQRQSWRPCTYVEFKVTEGKPGQSFYFGTDDLRLDPEDETLKNLVTEIFPEDFVMMNFRF